MIPANNKTKNNNKKNTHFARSYGIKISNYIIFFFLMNDSISSLYVDSLRYRGTIDYKESVLTQK